MPVHAILVLHIIVAGHWLGSDLVINSTFRYVSRAATLPMAERDRLLDHVMDVDQHVRYALILQLWLGTTLGALLGYFPGGLRLAGLATVLGLAWLVLVEFTHRLRKRPSGQGLGRLDRGLRYLTIVALIVIGAGTWSGAFAIAGWLGLKLALLAGVMLSGLGIRFELVRYFRVWAEIGTTGSTAGLERSLRGRYTSSTAFLVLLWLFVVAIVVVSIAKPG
ncbi:MAG: hypothetical protein QY320_02320 [Gammaproteobacteria bacterium]|nr:MAG: hypothetical protein QY320_02320 [Gammaproteobacteria bacterium]